MSEGWSFDLDVAWSVPVDGVPRSDRAADWFETAVPQIAAQGGGPAPRTYARAHARQHEPSGRGQGSREAAARRPPRQAPDGPALRRSRAAPALGRRPPATRPDRKSVV